MDAAETLTTNEAAGILGVSRARVHALITARRLPARKIGRDWTIARADLSLVAHRRPGRPRRLAGPEQQAGTVTVNRPGAAENHHTGELPGAPGMQLLPEARLEEARS